MSDVSVPDFFMQHKEDSKVFQAIFKAVEKSFVDGSPAWFVDRASSSIYTTYAEEMDLLTDEEVQDIFRTKHIFVANQFVPEMEFNEHGLSTLADLDKPVTIHGQWLLQLFT